MLSLIQCCGAIAGSIREKTNYGYLSEICFWAQENMSQLLVEKRFTSILSLYVDFGVLVLLKTLTKNILWVKPNCPH